MLLAVIAMKNCDYDDGCDYSIVFVTVNFVTCFFIMSNIIHNWFLYYDGSELCQRFSVGREVSPK
jgi:hypothetical protein